MPLRDIPACPKADVTERSRPQLKIGVVVDSAVIAEWTLELLQTIERSDIGEITLIIAATEQGAEGPRRGAAGRRRLLYRLYERLDALMFSDRTRRMAATPLTTAFPAARVVHLPAAAGASDSDPGGTLSSALRSEHLDVLLQLCSWIVPRHLRDLSRYGVWALEFGSHFAHERGPLFFWEVHNDHHTSPITLRILAGERRADRVLYRCEAATDPISPARNRTRAAQKAAYHLIQRLRDVREGAGAYLDLFAAGDAAACRHRRPPFPGNGRVVEHLRRVALRALPRIADRYLYGEHWYIAYRRGRCGDLLMGDPGDFRVLHPPPGRSFMDPFLFEHDSHLYLFFEDLKVSEGKGAISYVLMRRDGTTTAPHVALNRPYHVSYPCVFSWQGTAYLIPETSSQRTIELYRADRFPDRWSLEKILLEDIAASDATVLDHAGRLWLFVNVAVNHATFVDELFVFWANSPTDTWQPHPLNPVVADARSARPAGRIFMLDGELYRPGQDCSRRYGGGIVFSRIERLSETEYREVEVGRFDRDRGSGNVGAHSYTCAGGYEAVDGRTRRFGRGA